MAQTSSAVVPGSDAFTFGFDLGRLDITDGVIFDWGRKPGIMRAYGPDEHQADLALPEGVSGHTATHVGFEDLSGFLTNESDYTSNFSLTVDGKLAGAEWSAVSKSSLAFHGELFKQHDVAYDLHFGRSEIYTASRDLSSAGSLLASGFAHDLESLPATFDPTNPDGRFTTFFQTYGTHFIAQGTFGGRWVYLTMVEKNLFHSVVSTDVKRDLTAAYAVEDNSGSIDFATDFQQSASLARYSGSTSVVNDSIGGTWNHDRSTYIESTWWSPRLLLGRLGSPSSEADTSLVSIGTLISDSGRRQAFAEAVAAYLATAAPTATNVFGGYLPFPPDHVIQAPCDGIVTAMIFSTSDGDRGGLTAVSDASENPTTRRAVASQHSYEMEQAPTGSLVMPVRAGEYYAVQSDITYGSPGIVAVFHPLTVAGLGEWTAWNDGPAPQDGLLCASLSAANDEDMAYLRGYATVKHEDMLVAGAWECAYVDWDARVDRGSFAVPLPAGTPYRSVAHGYRGMPVFATTWIPLAAGLVLGPIETRTVGETYVANTDGFFFATLFTVAMWSARVDLQTSSDGTFSPASIMAASGASWSVHSAQGDAEMLGSALLPVPSGASYLATASSSFYGETGPNPALCFWVPIKRR